MNQAIFGWSVILTLALTPHAEASDWYTGAAPARKANDWIVAADGAVNVASNGSRTANLVVTGALTGTLSESGPRIRVEGLVGEFEYVSSAGNTTGRQTGIGVLGGYEWVMPGLSVSAFAGVDMRRTDWASVVPGAPAAGGAFGFTTAFNVYARPTATTMAHGFVSYSSVRDAFFARARFGWAMAAAYVGPEVAYLGDDTFRQARIGAHISGLSLGPLQIGLSSGYQQDVRSGSGGIYGALDVRAGF